MSTQACPKFDGFDVMAFLTPKDHTRLLREGETIPPSLEAGFDLLGKLDHNWIWVVEAGGEIKGVLVASPCHGCAFVWRVVIADGMANIAVIRLLRRFARDIRDRGMKGYITLLGSSSAVETRLRSIVEKLGAKAWGEYTIMASGLPKENV